MSAHLPGRGPAGTGPLSFREACGGDHPNSGPAPVCRGGSSAPHSRAGAPLAPSPTPQPAASAAAGMRPPVPQAGCRRRGSRAQLVQPVSAQTPHRLLGASGGRRGATADSSPEEAPSSAREAGGAPRAGTAGPGPRRENEGRVCSKSKAFHSPQCPQSGRPAPLLVHPCLRPKLQGALFLGQGTVTTVP